MGKSKTTQTSSSTTQNQLPAYMRQGSQAAVQRGMEINNRAYEGYDGQRIAEMSENERMGIQMARDNVGMGDADFQSARDALGRAGGSFTDEGVAEQYMNPYMEQVLAPQRRRQNEAFEAERASRRAGQGMKNAFGGRSDLYENTFESNFQRSQDELTGSAYGAAYESAQGLHGRERDRDITQAGAYSNLAVSQGGQARQQLRDLMATGGTERGRDQADLDFKYLEHLEERDWDVTNLDTLVKTLASVPHETTQQSDSTQTTTQQDSPMKTIAGIGAITAGAIMTGGASLAMGGTFWGGVGAGMMGTGGEYMSGLGEDEG